MERMERTEATEAVPASGWPGRRILRLHIVRGSFSASDAVDQASGQCAMDAAVWGNLPADILWRVMLFVPAAKHFQWQSVSRQWRQVLRSADFRSRSRQQQGPATTESGQERVVACVTSTPCGSGGDADTSSSRDSEVNPKVVDIDLASFVPSWFWTPQDYSVVATGAGLVCICNNSEWEQWQRNFEDRWAHWKPWTNRYCVLDPLTRTCTVLPRIPFMPHGWAPLTASTVSIYGDRWDDRDCAAVPDEEDWAVHLATCDLVPSGGGGRGQWVSAAHETGIPRPEPLVPPVVLALSCGGGEAFWYYDHRVHLLAPADGSGGGMVGELVEVATLDSPSPESLVGMDPAAAGLGYHQDPVLVSHRGALFVVAHLRRDRHPDRTVAGVWRLGRARTAWELVTRLDLAEVERITGLPPLGCGKRTKERVECVSGACGVREWLCCELEVKLRREWVHVVLGFNLDTGQWELLHQKRGAEYPHHAKPVELKPDLCLF